MYSSSTTTTTPSHQDLSLEIVDDISPPQSVSTGRPTPSPSPSGSTSPPGLTTSPVDTSVIIMTTSSNSISMQPYHHQQQPSNAYRPQIIAERTETLLPTRSGPVTIVTTSSNSTISMQPYHHHQQPSNVHRPQIIDHSKFAERMILSERSGPLLCAPKPKVRVKSLTFFIISPS